jgi:hypothetical protein
MRVFVAKKTNHIFLNNEIITESTYAAFYGFSVLGWEVVFFEGMPPEGLSREDVVVGWITQVKQALTKLGIEPPNELDYPEETRSYLGRNVWQSNLHKIYTDETTWPVFVKPVKGKQFDGKLITKLGDLIGLGDQNEDRKIWCSEPVNFVSEYRCFVRYGKLIDSRRYKGTFKTIPNYSIVEACIDDYKSAPAAYVLDFGVTDDGRTLLVETNDGFAVGSYGFHFVDYAKMVSARWSELVGIPDPCLF